MNPAFESDALPDEVAALVQTLRETEQRLQDLTGGEVDAVYLRSGQSLLLRGAQEQLRQSEEKFRNMFTGAVTGFAISTPQGKFIHVNDAYCGMLGYSEEELLSLHFRDLTHPDDLSENLQLRDDLLAGRRQNFSLEKRYLTKSGGTLWVRTSVSATHGQNGEIDTLIAVAENITDRKLAELRLYRLNRLHSVLSKTGEAIVQRRNKQELYDSVCQILVNEGQFRMASIAQVDAGAGVVGPAASFGSGLEYLQEPACVVPIKGGPLSNGTVGTALRTGVYDVCNDILADPRMEPWHKSALKNGFHANASFPILLRGAIVGVMVLYSGERGFFLADEIRMISSVANSVSFALEAFEKEQERSIAEEKARGRQSELEVLFDLVPAMLCIKDTSNKFQRVNQRLAETTGLSIAELEGKSAIEVYPREAAKYYSDDLEVISSGVPKLGIVETLQTQDGKELLVQTDKVPIHDRDGQVNGIVVMIQDITERTKSEEATRKLQARYRQLVDSNVQPVLFWNRNGMVISANDAFLRLVNHTREDLDAGRISWKALTPPEYAHLDRKCLEEIDAHGIGKPYEKEYLLESGKRIPILLGSAAFPDNPDEGVSFVLDLTELKRLEEQVFRAQRMESIGTLAAGIAHDLNNILVPIMISIELLKRVVVDHESKSILESMELSAKRGAEIISQVLSFARGMKSERIEVEPKHVLKDLEKIIKETFPKNISWKFTVSDNAWSIFADPTQVNQVLLNLCVNARDAMPNGGHLTIGAENRLLDEKYSSFNSAAKPGCYVQFSVTDTGTGMTRETADKIFEPFFTTKELHKGTGLGLSTVMAIVKSHEGLVNVYSESGIGTTMKVFLPAVTISSKPNEQESDRQGTMQGSGETVLVVDDEPENITLISKALNTFGYRVLTAANGAEGVRVYSAHINEISAVLTDMTMPVMDGATMIHALREMNPAVKVIAASGLGASDQSLPGVKYFLEKPYGVKALLSVVRRILDS